MRRAVLAGVATALLLRDAAAGVVTDAAVPRQGDTAVASCDVEGACHMEEDQGLDLRQLRVREYTKADASHSLANTNAAIMDSGDEGLTSDGRWQKHHRRRSGGDGGYFPGGGGRQPSPAPTPHNGGFHPGGDGGYFPGGGGRPPSPAPHNGGFNPGGSGGNGGAFNPGGGGNGGAFR